MPPCSDRLESDATDSLITSYAYDLVGNLTTTTGWPRSKWCQEWFQALPWSAMCDGFSSGWAETWRWGALAWNETRFRTVGELNQRFPTIGFVPPLMQVSSGAVTPWFIRADSAVLGLRT